MKGICFKEQLFFATIEGRKLQTRRIVVPPKGAYGLALVRTRDTRTFLSLLAVNEQGDAKKPGTEQEWRIQPKYKLGERVYLKEPYMPCPNLELIKECPALNPHGNGYRYRFSESKQFNEEWASEWCNKLYMPASAARYFIGITGCRAELLQDISDEDCQKEGISRWTPEKLGKLGVADWRTAKNMICWDDSFSLDAHFSARGAYAALIDHINGRGTWDSNPIVWVYDYQFVTPETMNYGK